MRQHRPKSLQRLSWNSRTKLGHISLQVGPNEIAAESKTVSVGLGEETVWQATAQPKLFGVAHGRSDIRDFQYVKRCHLDVLDAPGKAFTALAQQVHRSRPKQQKARVASAAASSWSINPRSS